MSFFKLTFFLNGIPLKKAKVHLEFLNQLPVKEFQDYQENKKWEVFHYHLQNNEAYKEFIGDFAKAQKWDDIPILKKNSIQKPIENKLSRGYSLSNVYIGSSSGSSGMPFVFAKDKFSHALTWAIMINKFLSHKIDLASDLQARFYGMPFEKKDRIKEYFKDLLLNRKRFPIYELSEKTFEKFLKKFQKERFVYINGYPSSLALFARYCQEQNIILKNICPSLQICVTTAEMLDEENRKLIKRSFGIPVVNEYGLSELGIMAFENKNYEWLLNEETVFIEVVDEHGKVLPPGKSGRIIATSLYNKAMPLIRYEVGDFGTLSNVKGKYRVLESLEGRINDMAVLPSGKKAPGQTFYYACKKLLEKSGKVKEFTIIQQEKDLFYFLYCSDEELDNKEEKLINKVLSDHLEPGIHLKLKKVNKIHRTAAGKLKQFTTKVNRVE